LWIAVHDLLQIRIKAFKVEHMIAHLRLVVASNVQPLW